MSRESDLLDSLEDAQDEYAKSLRTLKVGIWLGVLGIVSLVGTIIALSLLHSIGVDLGDLGLINIVFVVLGIAGSVITGGTWFEDLPRARKRLKRAEREHRNFMIER